MARSGCQPQDRRRVRTRQSVSVGCCGETHPGGSCDLIRKTMRLFQLVIVKERREKKKKKQFFFFLAARGHFDFENSGKESDPH